MRQVLFEKPAAKARPTSTDWVVLEVSLDLNADLGIEPDGTSMGDDWSYGWDASDDSGIPQCPTMRVWVDRSDLEDLMEHEGWERLLLPTFTVEKVTVATVEARDA
jgi:hypothetical protein